MGEGGSMECTSRVELASECDVQLATRLRSVMDAPRRPSPRARATVLCSDPRERILLGLGLGLMLLGGLFSSAFGWGAHVDLALALNGVPATGTVIATRVERNVEINGKHPTTIRFRYRDRGFAAEGSASSLDPALLARATDAAIVPIEIVPGHPGWARVAGATHATAGALIPVAIGVAFFSIGLACVLSAHATRRRRALAFAHGTPCVATVVYAGPDLTTQINGRRPFMIRWAFSSAGRSYSGSLVNMEATALQALVVGTQIIVLHDPERPTRNTAWVV
jgi:hypothetical protein